MKFEIIPLRYHTIKKSENRQLQKLLQALILITAKLDKVMDDGYYKYIWYRFAIHIHKLNDK